MLMLKAIISISSYLVVAQSSTCDEVLLDANQGEREREGDLCLLQLRGHDGKDIKDNDIKKQSGVHGDTANKLKRGVERNLLPGVGMLSCLGKIKSVPPRSDCSSSVDQASLRICFASIRFSPRGLEGRV